MPVAVLLAAAILSAGPPPAALEPYRPGPREKCPVCGMFVAKYPEWIAGVTFRDGTHAIFDGAKDLFKFWFDPGGFLPSRSREDVAAIFVTDYYTLEQQDAREAFYVVGSNVLGPMGHELVPFATQAAAKEFLRDHLGQRILRFDQVTKELVRSLDR